MRTLLIALVLATPLLASACNTVKGFGKDVSTAGGALENAAEKAK